jgi:hypothetical protein
MDPDATLEDLLRLIDLVTGQVDAEIDPSTDRPDVYRIAELLLALDSWLTAGGFMPRRWKPASRRSA